MAAIRQKLQALQQEEAAIDVELDTELRAAVQQVETAMSTMLLALR